MQNGMISDDVRKEICVTDEVISFVARKIGFLALAIRASKLEILTCTRQNTRSYYWSGNFQRFIVFSSWPPAVPYGWLELPACLLTRPQPDRWTSLIQYIKSGNWFLVCLPIHRFAKYWIFLTCQSSCRLVLWMRWRVDSQASKISIMSQNRNKHLLRMSWDFAGITYRSLE